MRGTCWRPDRKLGSETTEIDFAVAFSAAIAGAVFAGPRAALTVLPMAALTLFVVKHHDAGCYIVDASALTSRTFETSELGGSS